MFDEGHQFGRVGTESNKKKRQLPHPCTTQPARMGHPRKETRGKIKACPTRQRVAHLFKNQTRKGRPPPEKDRAKSKASQDFKDTPSALNLVPYVLPLRMV